MGLELFFSYGRNEEEALAAGHIVERLERLEYVDRVYRDNNELKPGDDWEEEVLKAARNADIFIYFLSAKSLSSEYCEKELSEFKKGKTKNKATVIPLYFESCDDLPEKKAQFLKKQSLPLFGENKTLKPYIEWPDLNLRNYKSIQACGAISTDVRATVQKKKEEIEKEYAKDKAAIKGNAGLLKSKVEPAKIELFEKVLIRYLENFSINPQELEPLPLQKLLLPNYYQKQNTAFEKCSLVESELKYQLAGYELYINDNGPRITLLPFELYQLNEEGKLLLRKPQIEVNETINKLRSMLNKRNLQRRIRVMSALSLDQ